ncbi:Aquaporin NIP2-1 [Apiospora kogelbergensis]|uniref:Aquaporin NIP2-1 n=1 Tax=Apiospora kogelbergensis TaxID=1337665 RepID=UPI003130B3C6
MRTTKDRYRKGVMERDVSPRSPPPKGRFPAEANKSAERADGVSFARNARPSIAIPARPWYQRRSYFTEGGRSGTSGKPPYLSFGVGVDPRQAEMFGPALGLALVGLCFGLVNFVATGTAPVYGGVTMSLARCSGMAVASGDWAKQWTWWVAPGANRLWMRIRIQAISGILRALLYNSIPPGCAGKTDD